jgi:hypothetical protein
MSNERAPNLLRIESQSMANLKDLKDKVTASTKNAYEAIRKMK